MEIQPKSFFEHVIFKMKLKFPSLERIKSANCLTDDN